MEPAGPGAAPATVANAAGHSRLGRRTLAIHCRQLAAGRPARVLTPTFILPDELNMSGYGLLASPTLCSGQGLEATVIADPQNRTSLRVKLLLRRYDGHDRLQPVTGEPVTLQPGEHAELRLVVPDTDGMPIAQVGLEITGDRGASGTVHLDRLHWTGEPDLTLTCPHGGAGSAWHRSWVRDVSSVSPEAPDRLRVIQNAGRGLLAYGCRTWRDYGVSADVTPHLVEACGLAARVQGLGRYHALLLSPGKLRLVKVRDDEQTVLAERDFDWHLTQTRRLALEARGATLAAAVDDQPIFTVDDPEPVLSEGAIALVVEEGRCAFGPVRIAPSA